MIHRTLAGIGRWLFKYRNAVGPAMFVLAVFTAGKPVPSASRALHEWLSIFGVLLALAGQALRIFTIGLDYIERGGRRRQVYASKLVQGGVFAHCRNPLYLGNILMCAGLALVAQSWSFYLCMVAVMLAYAAIVAAEEDFLSTQFGASYAAYRARVPRWIPRLAGWRQTLHGMRFQWGRVLVKEYNTTFLLLPALVALWLWSEHRFGDQPSVSAPAILTLTALWALAYAVVWTAKKRGWIRDAAAT